MNTQQVAPGTDQYVVFRLATQDYALHLSAVERIVRAVALTPLPSASAQVLGMVNIQGHIIPVVSMRKIYGLPEQELSISDQFILTRTGQSMIALLVDEVIGVESCDEHNIISAGSITPELDGVRVIARNGGELIILHNPERLPYLEAILQLEAAPQESNSA